MVMSKRDVQSAMTPITLSFNAVVEAMFWTPAETRATGGDELRGKWLQCLKHCDLARYFTSRKPTKKTRNRSFKTKPKGPETLFFPLL